MAPERPDVPAAVYVVCAGCGNETLHTVLKGTVGTRGGYRLSATVSCAECGHVHPTEIREAPEREVPIIVSRGGESTRTSITLAGDDDVAVDDIVIVDGRNVMVTAIETREGRRPERAGVGDVATIWGKDYDSVTVKFTINLGQKTIAKQEAAKPEDVFNVGDEHVFGRLRVTVHSIKTGSRLLRRGGATAAEISRVFAKPTRPDRKAPRPERPERERMRAREEETQRPGRGARFGARRARAAREAPATEDHEEEEAASEGDSADGAREGGRFAPRLPRRGRGMRAGDAEDEEEEL